MPPTLFMASALIALCLVVALRLAGALRPRIVLLCGVGAFYLVMVWRIPAQSGALFLVVPGAAQLVWANAGRDAVWGFFAAGLGLVLSALSLGGVQLSAPLVSAAIITTGIAGAAALLALRGPQPARAQAASNAMAFSTALVCTGGAFAALGKSGAPIGPAAAGFVIAAVVALRTPPGHWGDKRAAITFLVVATLLIGALLLDGRSLTDAAVAAAVAVFVLGAAMILSPRLLQRTAQRKPQASSMGADAPTLSDATLAHVVPLWADEDARVASAPLVMTRVSAHQVVQAAQLALRRQRRGDGGRLTLDVDGAPSELDFDGDAQRVTEALAIILDAALDRGPGLVTLSLRGDGRMLVFEIADTAAADERQPAIPERIRPFRDRGTALKRRGAAYAQHVVEQHGGALSTRFAPGGRIRQIELPRRRREKRPQSV